MEDIKWETFVKLYGSIIWPFVKPYIAAIASPASIEIYNRYSSDLDFIGYTFEEVYDYILILSYDSFLNAIDIFNDNGTPLVPEMPEIK